MVKKKSCKNVRIALKNLPEGLYETYDEAIKRIREQDADDVKLAERVLSWISYALRPLTVKEIQHALAIQPGEKSVDEEAVLDEDLIIHVCAGLVTIDRESDVIRLIHFTMQEHFERNRRNIFPDGQTSITLTCLTYLSFDVFETGYCSSDEQMEARLRDNLFYITPLNIGGIMLSGRPRMYCKARFYSSLLKTQNFPPWFKRCNSRHIGMRGTVNIPRNLFLDYGLLLVLA